jgi:bacterioferritin-associated ferredoxin
MIVCSCNRLTDADVADAICGGAGTPDDVYESCGCRKQCGRCAATMARLLGAAGRASASLSVERNSVTV